MARVKLNSGLPWLFGVCFVASLIMIAIALHWWGAAEIRAESGEVVFLTFVAAVWLFLNTKLFSLFGLSLQDDAMDRRNVAALIALCGAVLAVAFIYAGSSVGEGPSYLNNLFCVLLGTGSLIVLWILLEAVGKVSRSIAEERDLASGIRMCGFLLAVGLVLGRALAGDWQSEAETIHDFVRDSWPASLVLAIAVVIEKFTHPSRHQPFPAWPSCGLLPALAYIALVGAWLWHLGAWEGMPR